MKPVRRASLVQGIEEVKDAVQGSGINIDHIVMDLQDTLDEVVEHNQIIKHFLRGGLYGMGGAFINFVVFMLGPHP